MSKISAYPLRTLVSGDEIVVAIGGQNYRAKFDNLVEEGHIHGLTLSNNAADATNDIDIAAGQAKDTANSVLMTLASALTKRLDASWVAGTNQGMLSSSLAIANTTYHIFLMRVGGADDIGADTSASGANLVIDHSATNLRRIGSIVRAAGAIYPFVQDGDLFQYLTLKQDIVEVNPGINAVTRTMSVPIGIRVEGIFTTGSLCTVPASENPGPILLSDLSVTDEAPNISGARLSVVAYSAPSQVGAGDVRVMTNTSGQIRSRITVSTAGTTLYVSTRGWVDTRGRLS